MVKTQFPEFDLEGKVQVWEAGIDGAPDLLVYSRRRKRPNGLDQLGPRKELSQEVG